MDIDNKIHLSKKKFKLLKNKDFQVYNVEEALEYLDKAKTYTSKPQDLEKIEILRQEATGYYELCEKTENPVTDGESSSSSISSLTERSVKEDAKNPPAIIQTCSTSSEKSPPNKSPVSTRKRSVSDPVKKEAITSFDITHFKKAPTSLENKIPEVEPYFSTTQKVLMVSALIGAYLYMTGTIDMSQYLHRFIRALN